MKSAGAIDPVKHLVAKRKRECISSHQSDIRQVESAHATDGPAEHRSRDVQADDKSILTHHAGPFHREVSVAASKIENDLTRLEFQPSLDQRNFVIEGFYVCGHSDAETTEMIVQSRADARIQEPLHERRTKLIAEQIED